VCAYTKSCSTVCERPKSDNKEMHRPKFKSEQRRQTDTRVREEFCVTDRR